MEGRNRLQVLFGHDGRFAYVSNRDATTLGRDGIAVFSVVADAGSKDGLPMVARVGAAHTGWYPA